jgi:hypothetical protein
MFSSSRLKFPLFMQKDKYWNYRILQIIFYFCLIILAFSDAVNSMLYNIVWSGRMIMDSKFVRISK